MHIRTKWHRVLELVRAKQTYFTAPRGGTAVHSDEVGADANTFQLTVEGLSELPRFVFDHELLSLAKSDEFYKSLMDMKRAGVLRLPFPQVVVEMPHDQTVIAYMAERSFAIAQSGSDDVLPGQVIGAVLTLNKDADGEYVTFGPSTVGLDLEYLNGAPNLRVNAHAGPWWSDHKDAPSDLIANTHFKDAQNLGAAWFAMLVLMTTRGVEKEMIDPIKLNRHRKASGKPAIPKHTYVHIGHVYQRDGTTKKYDERKSPRPHWRRGHVRNVRHGPGHRETKTVWINAMLVSWHGDEVAEELRKPDYVISR